MSNCNNKTSQFLILKFSYMEETEYIGCSMASMYMDAMYGGIIYSTYDNPHDKLLTFINKK